MTTPPKTMVEIRDAEAENAAHLEVISPKYGKFYFIVDSSELNKIKNKKWFLKKENKIYNYAVAEISPRPKRKHVRLHRFIMDAPPGSLVDHINGNTLDNRKSNLRICTLSENAMNRRKRPKKVSSKYYGVSFNNGRWRAKITLNKKGLHLGSFKNEVEAAIAYNEALIKYKLTFCVKNTISNEALAEIRKLRGEG